MEFWLYSEELDVFVFELLKFGLEYFDLVGLSLDYNPLDKFLNFRFFEYISHDHIKNILIFKQTPILTSCQNLQIIDISIDPNQELHKNTSLINNSIKILDAKLIQSRTEYLIDRF